MEAIGLMLPCSSSVPAIDEAKQAECRRIGQAVRNLLEQNIRPRDVLSRKAFENATAAIAAIGGSTNGVLHLLALAREAQVEFGLVDMQAIFRRTPVYCSFAPRGKLTMVDLHRTGGSPVLLRRLIEAHVLQGDCLTVSGKTLAENVADAGEPAPGQTLIAPLDAPFKPYADMQICFGNLAPGGIVFKVSSMQEPRFRGRAVCFSTAKDAADAVAARRIRPGHVIVLRYQGPVAAGMPEALIASAALAVPELDGKVALVSDTRVSGVSHGAIGVHCAPEAVVGGPLALVQDGDEISFDLLAGETHWHVSEEEMAQRRRDFVLPVSTRRQGYLLDFAATAAQANYGCVSKVLYPECAV
jgi:dihydroxy-acid dehydratase